MCSMQYNYACGMRSRAQSLLNGFKVNHHQSTIMYTRPALSYGQFVLSKIRHASHVCIAPPGSGTAIVPLVGQRCSQLSHRSIYFATEAFRVLTTHVRSSLTSSSSLLFTLSSKSARVLDTVQYRYCNFVVHAMQQYSTVRLMLWHAMNPHIPIARYQHNYEAGSWRNPKSEAIK